MRLLPIIVTKVEPFTDDAFRSPQVLEEVVDLHELFLYNHVIIAQNPTLGALNAFTATQWHFATDLAS